jgi:orotidine-5'-phosphate decarboxylase
LIERLSFVASFGKRLQAALEQSQLCVGIDPSESELIRAGLPDNAAGARDFGLRLIEAATGRVGIIKPQVAYFERFGSLGFAALEEVYSEARAAGLMILSDAKRADIGSTLVGYAQAWFGDDSPLRSDALTVSPYLGPISLSELMHYAKDINAGIFLLAATSNPEAMQLQSATLDSKTVSEIVVEGAKDIGGGDAGVVIGATQDLSVFGLDWIVTQDIGIPVLAPGFGFQGAKLSDLRSIFGVSTPRVLANVSRAITMEGPEKLASQIDKAKLEL